MNFYGKNMPDKLLILKKIAHEMGVVPLDSIHEDSTFDSMNADSLDRVEFMMAIEYYFDIEISDNDISKCNTIKDLCNLIHQIKTGNPVFSLDNQAQQRDLRKNDVNL